MAERQERAPGKSVKSGDSTTTISKMLSWLLRHGAKHKAVGLETKDGWIKLSDVLETDYFKEVSKDALMKVIIDSNSQKPRYQLSADCFYIRAYSYTEQKALKEVPGGSTAPAVAEKKSADGSLRSDAPEFVPSQSPTAAPALQGYWPAFTPMMMPYLPVQVVGKNNTGPVHRELGRIKSFNEEKGYGFIDCPRVTQQFGRDLFVHKAQMSGFNVGDEVTLVVTLSEAGMPQAKDLQSGTGKPTGSSGKGKSKGKGKEKGKEKKGKSDTDKSESKGEGKGKGKEGKGKKKDKKKESEETSDAQAASEEK